MFIFPISFPHLNPPKTGSVWFLTFPLLVAATPLLPPYTRHQVVTTVSLTSQLCAVLVLVAECLTASDYFRLSSLSKTGASVSGAAVVAPVVVPQGKGKISVD